MRIFADMDGTGRVGKGLHCYSIPSIVELEGDFHLTHCVESDPF